jgi:sulfate adenylyltransferase subunit 2
MSGDAVMFLDTMLERLVQFAGDRPEIDEDMVDRFEENWTEMDVWQYIRQEKIPLPSLYFSHQRKIINRHGQLLDTETGFVNLLEEEKAKIQEMTIRFRTVGDVTCTGAVLSEAATLDDIVAEVAAARQTERGTRADDRRSETAMEDRKKEGYF